MPNWCENRLVVRGDDKQLKQLLQEIRYGAEDQAVANLIPMPEELEPYGCGWALDNWGTKWMDGEWSYDEMSDGYFEVKYLTAWSPFHDRFWHKVSARFPKLVFRASYWEQGMDYCGIGVYGGGRAIYEMDNGQMNESLPKPDWDNPETWDAYYDALDNMIENMEIEADRHSRYYQMWEALSDVFAMN